MVPAPFPPPPAKGSRCVSKWLQPELHDEFALGSSSRTCTAKFLKNVLRMGPFLTHPSSYFGGMNIQLAIVPAKPSDISDFWVDGAQ